MDEPLSALDKKLRDHMQIELRQLHEKLGMTTVYVTHDQREALTMADRIAVINQGRLMQLATPASLYNQPVNRFVADFIGESSFIPVTRKNDSLYFDGQQINTSHALPGDSQLIALVRPERMKKQSGTEDTHEPGDYNRLPATATNIVYQGDSYLMHLQLTDGTALRERMALLGLCSPAIILVLTIMVIPVGWLFYMSFVGADGQFSLENYDRMLKRKSYFRIFKTTFTVSLLTTGICVLIGYPLAYFLSQLPKRMANICLITVLLPFWTSLLVRTYAWLVLLQKKGLVNTWAINPGLWDEPVKMVHNLNGTLIGMVHICCHS